AGDGDDRRRIHLGVGEASDEVGGAGAAGGHADADFAGGAGVAVGHEPAALLVARQNGPQPVLDFGERLVDGHGGAAGIGEHDLDALANEGFDEDIGAGHGLAGGLLGFHG